MNDQASRDAAADPIIVSNTLWRAAESGAAEPDRRQVGLSAGHPGRPCSADGSELVHRRRR
jgi:hypothetical protein